MTVSNLQLTSGNAIGVMTSYEDGTLSIDPVDYQYLGEGVTEVVTYSYDITDGEGGLVSQTATVTITGTDDAPVVSGGVDLGQVIEDGTTLITEADLLHHATDVDTDVSGLSVANLALTDDAQGGLEAVTAYSLVMQGAPAPMAA